MVTDDIGTGGPRSAGTRAAILKAARAQFVANSYDGATIRKVAADAGIDPAMVMRYFGSKAGLFAAASAIELKLAPLEGVGRSRLGQVIVRHFLTQWETAPVDDPMMFVLRSAATNEGAAKRMQAIFIEQVAEPIAAVLDDPDHLRRAALVSSQLLGVVLCRYILCLEPLASWPAEQVIADVAPAVQRYLTGPLPPR
jgi:AcrR family transcriptional regulator